MNNTRRRIALGTMGAVTLATAGCMTKPLRPLNADGSYCYKFGKQFREPKTCTTGPVPSADIEASVKTFEADPQRLTVYVVRQRWADAHLLVSVSADDGQPLETLPYSFVVLRLGPGEHRLRASWRVGKADLAISGQAGEILYVELIGWAWKSSAEYRLESGDASTRARAATLKLVGIIG